MRGASGVVLLVAAVLCAGCATQSVGPMQHDTSSFDRDNSELVHANLTMRAGDLKVDSGTDKLASADFNYNVPMWKPSASYKSSNGVGYLTLTQPEEGGGVHISGGRKNEWDVKLNREVAMDVAIHFGAGEARINLGALNLRGLDMSMGAGELDLDLRGSPKMSYTAHVSGGVGEATVHLPSNVGIEATATGGIGGIDSSGLHNDGHRYYNDALGKSNVTIHLDIAGGVGSIKLIAE